MRSLAHPEAHVCRVCGRAAQIDDLCGRHGGSVGLIVQTENLPATMRYGLRLLMTGGVLTMLLGLLCILLGGALTGREDAPAATKLAGFAMIAVGLVTIVLAMYVSQLRPWAWPAGIGLAGLAAVVSLVLVVVISPASSFVTLVAICTFIPYAGAAVCIAVWRARLTPADRGVAEGGAAGAPAAG